jgi:hypothetical protein
MTILPFGYAQARRFAQDDLALTVPGATFAGLS